MKTEEKDIILKDQQFYIDNKDVSLKKISELYKHNCTKEQLENHIKVCQRKIEEYQDLLNTMDSVN